GEDNAYYKALTKKSNIDVRTFGSAEPRSTNAGYASSHITADRSCIWRISAAFYPAIRSGRTLSRYYIRSLLTEWLIPSTRAVAGATNRNSRLPAGSSKHDWSHVFNAYYRP